MTRTYHSPLREEQTEQTRDRILAKAAEALADPELREITVPEVARRAGISVRTAYRHFPTKDALYDAVNEMVSRQTSPRGWPETLAALLEYVRGSFRRFAASRDRILAARRAGPHQEMRERRRAKQVRGISRILLAEVPEADPGALRRAAAGIHPLCGSDCYLLMSESWGLSAEEAGDAAASAIEAIVDKLRKRGG